MKKILFTDLFGTLISPDIDVSKKYFGNLDRECKFVCQYLNEFLSKGNDVVVVTGPNGHDRLGFIFNHILAKIDSSIVPHLRSHIAYYLQGEADLYERDFIHIENKNGRIYYIGRCSFQGIKIDKKEEAISAFLKKISFPYQIYGIGDSIKDIPMLLRVEEMGGKSSIIDLNLYRNTILSMRKEKTIDKMIENQIDIEFQFQIEQLLNNRRLEGRTDDNWNVQEMIFWRKIEKRRYELYQLLYKGELDFDEIDCNYSKYYLCSEYKTMNELLSFRKNQFFESYPFSDDVVQKVMDMSCYASFGEYYTKVLKRN